MTDELKELSAKLAKCERHIEELQALVLMPLGLTPLIMGSTMDPKQVTKAIDLLRKDIMDLFDFDEEQTEGLENTFDEMKKSTLLVGREMAKKAAQERPGV